MSILQHNDDMKRMILVLNILDEMVPEEQARQISVYPFMNGREKGFNLALPGTNGDHLGGRHIAWANNRNSDEFVIYMGDGYECPLGGGNIGKRGDAVVDEEYKNRRYFSHREIMPVVEFIMDYISQAIGDYQRERATA